MQPPATSCWVIRNNTPYLEPPNPKLRIVKRSANLDDFYHRNDEECLEIADNVVFERLRKDSKLNPLAALSVQMNKGTMNDVRENYDLNNDRVRRETQEGTSTSTEESPVEDLKYKQLVFEENDPEAKTIDFETLQRKNRPADVLEYKRFLNVSSVLCFRGTYKCITKLTNFSATKKNVSKFDKTAKMTEWGVWHWNMLHRIIIFICLFK